MKYRKFLPKTREVLVTGEALDLLRRKQAMDRSEVYVAAPTKDEEEINQLHTEPVQPRNETKIACKATIDWIPDASTCDQYKHMFGYTPNGKICEHFCMAAHRRR